MGTNDQVSSDRISTTVAYCVYDGRTYGATTWTLLCQLWAGHMLNIRLLFR
jgi:hypothetical protein